MSKTNALPKGYAIRWRKSSATFVIYKGRKVWESGFDTEQRAAQYFSFIMDNPKRKFDYENDESTPAIQPE